MNRDDEILKAIRIAFVETRRPEHFTNYTHCEECKDHDDVFRAHSVDTLSRSDVGSVGWDPALFLSPQGFAYYFPGLARIALAPLDDHHDWYLPQLLCHLQRGGRGHEWWDYCSPEQRDAITAFLHHVIATRTTLLDRESADDALRALGAWTSTIPAK